MKLTKRVVGLLFGSVVATGLTAACGGDETTDSAGAGGEAAAAPSGPQCAEAGGKECSGSASGLVCPEGSKDAVAFTCATGEVCDKGECVGQCKAGETECVGGTVERICTADGRSWVNVTCAEGEVCADGKCGLEGGFACVPGARECDGAGKAKTCKEDGSGWETLDCPGATECSDGACRGTVCEVGSTRCDISTHDIPRAFLESQFFESSASQPNFAVVYKCEDGEKWVSEPCLSDDETSRACAYTGVDAAEAAKYRGEANKWMLEFIAAQNSNSGVLPEAPTPPAIPAAAKAECVVTGCDWEQAFFESPAMTRFCGLDPNDSEEPKENKSFSQCDGYLPYANTTLSNYECTGLTACGYGKPGCFETACFPGEVACADADTYQICNYNESQPEYSSWSTYDCPGEVIPGACVESGADGKRTAKCDGVTVPMEK